MNTENQENLSEKKEKESNRKSVGELMKDPKINWYIDFKNRRKQILQKEKIKGN